MDERVAAVDAEDGAAATARRADFRDAEGVVYRCLFSTLSIILHPQTHFMIK